MKNDFISDMIIQSESKPDIRKTIESYLPMGASAACEIIPYDFLESVDDRKLVLYENYLDDVDKRNQKFTKSERWANWRYAKATTIGGLVGLLPGLGGMYCNAFGGLLGALYLLDGNLFGLPIFVIFGTGMTFSLFWSTILMERIWDKQKEWSYQAMQRFEQYKSTELLALNQKYIPLLYEAQNGK